MRGLHHRHGAASCCSFQNRAVPSDRVPCRCTCEEHRIEVLARATDLLAPRCAAVRGFPYCAAACHKVPDRRTYKVQFRAKRLYCTCRPAPGLTAISCFHNIPFDARREARSVIRKRETVILICSCVFLNPGRASVCRFEYPSRTRREPRVTGNEKHPLYVLRCRNRLLVPD